MKENNFMPASVDRISEDLLGEQDRKEKNEEVEVVGLEEFDENYFRSISEGSEYDWIAFGMENCKNQRYYTVVGKDNIKLGIIGIYDTDNEQNITHIVIDPEFRGKGLVPKFYDELIRKEKVPNLIATINVANTASEKSHKRAGFKKISDEAYEKEFNKYKYMYNNEKNIEREKSPVNIREAPEKEIKKELMAMPEIVIVPEKGISLMSFMLKGYDHDWGNNDHELVIATNEYFRNNPLSDTIRKELDDLKALKKDGINQEILFNVSLSYENPERFMETSLNLTRDEGINDPDELQTRLLKLMEELDKVLNSNAEFIELKEKFDAETLKDIEIRKERQEKSEEEIKKLLEFFRPKAETTKAKKVNIIPTDHLYEKESGMGFSIGEEIIIRVSLEDFTKSNQWTHEFLHSVINPINDKLFENLTDEQKEKIIKMSPGDQRQHYEENANTLLNESFIRTYVNFFEGGKGPFTYEYLKNYVSGLSEEQFQKSLSYAKFKQNLDTMGISSSKELSENLKGYFEKYKKDLLGNIIYELYEDYRKEIQNNKNVTFEDFVLEKFPTYLDKAM